jgi:hypothetical protein
VNVSRPGRAVSSYERIPTGSGNRRQMATPSRSNLTIRWVELNSLLSNSFSSSTCDSQVNSAFTSREHGSQAGISDRWRHLAEVTGVLDRPTTIYYWCSVDVSRPAATVRELLALFEMAKTDRKRKSPLGGATWRKSLDHPKGRPRFAIGIL